MTLQVNSKLNDDMVFDMTEFSRDFFIINPADGVWCLRFVDRAIQNEYDVTFTTKGDVTAHAMEVVWKCGGDPYVPYYVMQLQPSGELSWHVWALVDSRKYFAFMREHGKPLPF